MLKGYQQKQLLHACLQVKHTQTMRRGAHGGNVDVQCSMHEAVSQRCRKAERRADAVIQKAAQDPGWGQPLQGQVGPDSASCKSAAKVREPRSPGQARTECKPPQGWCGCTCRCGQGGNGNKYPGWEPCHGRQPRPPDWLHVDHLAPAHIGPSSQVSTLSDEPACGCAATKSRPCSRQV